ncbi:MAG: hypothetical protein ABWZ40_09030 [Caulobacterales bacterium]
MPDLLPVILVMIVAVCFQTAQPHFPARFSTKGLLRPGLSSGSSPANPAWFLTSLIFIFMGITTFSNAFVQGAREGFTEDTNWWVALLGIVAVALMGAILSMIRALHVWTWDAEGIEWRGLFRKIHVSWTQAERFGQNWDGSWFVGPEKGPRITWSRINTQAADAVLAAVRYARPDLAAPAP